MSALREELLVHDSMYSSIAMHHNVGSLNSTKTTTTTLQHTPTTSSAYSICYAVVFIILMICQLCDIFTFNLYYQNGNKTAEIAYFCFKFIASTTYSIIMCTSIYQQRDSLRSSSISSGNGGLQSPIVNTILIMAGLTYFGLVSSVTTFYGDSDLVLPAIGNIVYLSGSILLSSHLIGDLKWAHITSSARFERWTLNWWATIYLLIGFCIGMMVTVVGPWLNAGHKEFVEVNNLIEAECGNFVQILIMYICRPSLTIVQFRVIERLIHQLIHANSAHSHHTHEHVEEKKKMKDKKGITAMDVLLLTPIVLFVLVFDLISLDNNNAEIVVKINYFIWFCVYFSQSLWAILVIFVYQRDGVLKKNKILSNHFPMFISCAGTFIAVVGTFGDDMEYEIVSMWMSSFADLIFIILQCVVIVLLNESVLKESKEWVTMPRMVKLYGKVIIIVNMLLIFHAFLGEAAHLEHAIETQDHDESDWLEGLSFIFFFWRIEYHLSVIERVDLSK